MLQQGSLWCNSRWHPGQQSLPDMQAAVADVHAAGSKTVWCDRRPRAVPEPALEPQSSEHTLMLEKTPESKATIVSASGYFFLRSCRSWDVFGLRTAATAFAPAARTCHRHRMRICRHPVHVLC